MYAKKSVRPSTLCRIISLSSILVPDQLYDSDSESEPINTDDVTEKDAGEHLSSNSILQIAFAAFELDKMSNKPKIENHRIVFMFLPHPICK
ncbi:MAG: hypothetical protein A2Z74_00905 [Chloroflexi bacterium RBG_13_46_9]|nr:MAG: hypothetical protein A2Z74_00905 [Chloroflexi bacterium RBG_13_46_9]